MERINTARPKGLNHAGLRIWGMVFLVLGILGKSLIQNRFLGMSGADAAQMLEAALNTDAGMTAATIALVCQAAETCAAPLFCFLLVEGVQHTKDFYKYFLRVTGLALLSELPYNLAMGGKFLDLSGRNPVFGLVLAMVLLYFYRRYSEKSFGNVLVKLLVTAAAVIWGQMLGITDGICCVILVSVLWGFRNKPVYRNIMGCAAAILCTLVNPFYIASPMVFMMLHFYNGEKGEENRVFNYLAYPVLLLLIGLAAMFLF